MIVLGIDASLRGTGLAVIEQKGSQVRARHWEVVKLPASAPHSDCLRAISERVDAILAAHRPDAAAVEGGFVAERPFAEGLRETVDWWEMGNS